MRHLEWVTSRLRRPDFWEQVLAGVVTNLVTLVLVSLGAAAVGAVPVGLVAAVLAAAAVPAVWFAVLWAAGAVDDRLGQRTSVDVFVWTVVLLWVVAGVSVHLARRALG